MFSSPATNILISNCQNLVSAFPKLLFLGPRFSFGHNMPLSSQSDSSPPCNLSLNPCLSHPSYTALARLVLLCDLLLSLFLFDLLVFATRGLGPSDSPAFESDNSAAGPTLSGTPRTLSAWSAVLHSVKLCLKSEMLLTESCSDFLAVAVGLALTFVCVCFRSWPAFASELCCRAPLGARNRLRLPSDSSVTLASSSLRRWLSRSRSRSTCSYFCIRIWAARSSCSFLACASLASISASVSSSAVSSASPAFSDYTCPCFSMPCAASFTGVSPPRHLPILPFLYCLTWRSRYSFSFAWALAVHTIEKFMCAMFSGSSGTKFAGLMAVCNWHSSLRLRATQFCPTPLCMRPGTINHFWVKNVTVQIWERNQHRIVEI